MRPLLKWAGGKRHIAPVIQKHFPEGWEKGTYFEPFLGGAALFLEAKPNRSRLSDVNSKLIRFYTDVKKNPNGLFDQITKLAIAFDSLEDISEKKDFYLDVRESFNNINFSLESSARFFALNKLCFNGLYRENKKGFFNVPYGQKTKFPSISIDDFLSASKLLKQATLEVTDFESATARAESGDFVYFDPPYIPLNETANFTSYSSEGFGLEDQERLANTMRALKKRGVKVLLSNSSTPLTEKTYSGLRKVKISAPRMVSAKSSGRGTVEELLIMNY